VVGFWSYRPVWRLQCWPPLFSFDIAAMAVNPFSMNQPNPHNGNMKQTRAGLIVPGHTRPSDVMVPKDAPAQGTEAPPGFIPRGNTLLAIFIDSSQIPENSPIHLTESARESMGSNTVEARVLTTGPHCKEFVVGDRILIHKAVGNGVTIKGRSYRIIREEDIVGKFVEEA
jgi:co-chaperonin GroES (HSP10)